jgi:hypothetical protein
MAILTSHSSAELVNRLAVYRDNQIFRHTDSTTINPNNIKQLNWTSLDDIDINDNLLNEGQPSPIRAICCPRLWCSNKPSSLWFGNTLMANMAQFELGSVMAYCGTKGNHKAKNTPCQKWRYCDRCANARRKSLYHRYTSLFGDNCFFVTITHTHKYTYAPGSYTGFMPHWNVLTNYLNTLEGTIIKGHYATLECNIHSLYPVPILNPHIHLICSAAEDFKSYEYNNIKVDVKPVKSQDHWDNCISYPVKAMNLYSVYNDEWTPDNSTTLNNNFKDMLAQYRQDTLNRKFNYAYGTFNMRSSLYKQTYGTKAGIISSIQN